jgi:hypothetical protein
MSFLLLCITLLLTVCLTAIVLKPFLGNRHIYMSNYIDGEMSDGDNGYATDRTSVE